MAKVKRNQNKLDRIEDSLQQVKSIWGPFYYVQDLDRAVAFYTRILGMSLKQQMGKEWAEVKLGGNVIGLHAGSAGSKKAPTLSTPARAPGEGATVSLIVDDIEGFVKMLKTEGVVFSVEGIVDSGAGKMAEFQDTEGNWLHLIQMR